MMPGTITIIVGLLAGFGLGVVFFGGLWLTVRALPRSTKPTALMLGSFWARTILVVAGFAAAAAGNWQTLILCLLGFTLARFVLARYFPGPGGTGRTAE
jgi:F1F0 ATPase subunit 2